MKTEHQSRELKRVMPTASIRAGTVGSLEFCRRLQPYPMTSVCLCFTGIKDSSYLDIKEELYTKNVRGVLVMLIHFIVC